MRAAETFRKSIRITGQVTRGKFTDFTLKAAVLMHLVTPGSGFVWVALWAFFFVTLQCFSPEECASKVQRLSMRG